MSLKQTFLNQISNIEAKVIKDSINRDGDRITTFELEYPRFIHAEFMTHRNMSKNSSSSRAIPIGKMVSLIKDNPATPVYWGKKQSGMQAKEELSNNDKRFSKFIWKAQMNMAFLAAKTLDKLGLHKQLSNRILEPFQMIKIVCTTSSLDNFFNLRIHKDAQPEIIILANNMYKAYKNSTPKYLKSDEWHLPYVDVTPTTKQELEDAIKLSVANCAAVSYRTEAMDMKKADKIFNMLINAEIIHASPFEHVAKPITKTVIDDNLDKALNMKTYPSTWEPGITHLTKNMKLCSGNSIGFIQYRHLLDKNTCYKYSHEPRLNTFN